MQKEELNTLESWIDKATSSYKSLLTIPIQASTKNTSGFSINIRWLCRQLNLDRNHVLGASELNKFVDDVIGKMIKMKIILPNGSPSSNDKRRRILLWYKNLTAKEFKSLQSTGKNLNWSQACPVNINYYDRKNASIQELIDEVNIKYLALKSKDKVHKETPGDKIIKWCKAVEFSRKRLLEIEVSFSLTSQYKMAVDRSWLARHLKVSRKVAERNKKVWNRLEDIIRRMIDENILIEGEAASPNNMRRRMLHWYEKLNLEEKLKIPTFGKKINWKQACPFSISHERCNHAVKNIIEDIDSKHKGLLQNFKEEEHKRGYIKTQDEKPKVFEWLEKAKKDASYQWKIGLSSKDGNIRVSKNWIQSEINISASCYTVFKDEINQIIPVLFENGVLIRLESLMANLSRIRVLTWLQSQTIETLNSLPIRNNRLSYSYIKSEITSPNSSDCYKCSIEKINKILNFIGRVDADGLYIAKYKQEISNRDHEFIANRDAQAKLWLELKQIRPNSITDLECSTVSNPLLSIQHLFALQISPELSNIDSVKAHFSNFSSFIEKTYGTEGVSIVSIFDQFLLIDLRAYFATRISENNLAASSANSTISFVRSVIRKLKSLGFETKNIIEVEGFESKRTTDRYRPFSIEERMLVTEKVNFAINQRKEQITPTPLELDDGEFPFDRNYRGISGKLTEKNAYWMFVNMFNGKLIFDSNAKTEKEKCFVRLLKSLGGVHASYRAWGLVTDNSPELIFPYFLKLAQITALNSESLCSLTLNDFIETHPLTGKPYLRFWKTRGDGASIQHQDLFDSKYEWLTSEQSIEVQEIFLKVELLTANIRPKCDENISNNLFIYENQKGVIKPFDIYTVINECTRFTKIYHLTLKDNRAFQFNIARFRPTFVSELLHNGVSIRKIQLILGHKSIHTTIAYLDRLDFFSKARKKLHKIIENIHQKAVFKPNVDAESKVSINEENLIFRTPLTSCANIFDPPEFIRALKGYTEGQACSLYNMCLRCDNVLITVQNLPDFFVMQRQYCRSLSSRGNYGSPIDNVLVENILLLDEILNSESSDFSTEELKVAEEISFELDDKEVY